MPVGTPEDISTWQARIPADIDRPEPLAFTLTARQLLILAPVVLAGWGLFLALKDLVPLGVLGAGLAPVIGAAAALALGERDGLSLDRLAWTAAAWAASPKHLVAAPHGEVPALPRWAPATRRGPKLEPLRLPAAAITHDGVIALDGRCAALISCTTLPFQLASGREQDQVLGAFAAVLDSLAEPVQILVQRRGYDLAPFTGLLRSNAPHLAHPALEAAAEAHADFLDELRHRHELSQQQILVAVTTTGHPAKAGPAVLRRAEDTADRLAALGIRTQVLDGPMAEQALRQALAPPDGTPLTDRDEEDEATP